MFDGQMEMSFGAMNVCPPRGQRRQSRARWWFQRMRQVVERATDWQQAPPARPEQIWLEATHRQSAVAAPRIRRPADRRVWE